MVHIALPDSTIINNGDNKYKEGHFADIAVPMLFNKVCGGFINFKKEYRASIYGGALSSNKLDVFNVGQKNLIKIKEILNENNIRFEYMNTGGYYSRTVEVDVKTGTPVINIQPINI